MIVNCRHKYIIIDLIKLILYNEVVEQYSEITDARSLGRSVAHSPMHVRRTMWKNVGRNMERITFVESN